MFSSISSAASRSDSPPSVAVISAMESVRPTGKSPGPARRTSTANRWARTMASFTAA